MNDEEMQQGEPADEDKMVMSLASAGYEDKSTGEHKDNSEQELQEKGMVVRWEACLNNESKWANVKHTFCKERHLMMIAKGRHEVFKKITKT